MRLRTTVCGVTTEPLPAGHVFASDEAVMRHALSLAEQARGRVEPNPMVGAVIVDDERRLIADGYHQVFGGPHAEADALAKAGEAAQGQTLFVTLEPCAHHGKQPPCAEAVIAAGVKRLVCAMRDPFPEVAGKGFEMLRAVGVEAEVGLCEADARRLNAPFLKRVATGRPYVIAKYAMTLDGKMATSTGHSMWISGPESRASVHEIRGCVDAIIVGAGTAAVDDPKLTVRPPGPRTPVRVVLGGTGEPLSTESHLVRTANDVPVLYYVTEVRRSQLAEQGMLAAYEQSGVDVTVVKADELGRPDVMAVLDHLAAERQATNVLLEGGARVLGRFRSADAIDECRVFIAPKVIGAGLAPMGNVGTATGDVVGLDAIPERPNVEIVSVEPSGKDVAIRALVPRPWLTVADSAPIG